ncbi:hypothetical protein AMATHDRAFT_63170 [Amanita thiersii Skay4041]|uniref:DUF6535 domain-containing protein n=1 Tax=Amanita thiersii Skay4041 TaxID=703135 RepID=A0A2A9NFS9_9AGAR|nr:hypothetical protein AMATHDRAFT_63170 [Amanita thiersii Skay4041]
MENPTRFTSKNTAYSNVRLSLDLEKLECHDDSSNAPGIVPATAPSVVTQQTKENPGFYDKVASLNLQSGQKPWRCGEPFRFPLPKNSDDPLGSLYDRMKRYDKNICDAWRDEIEKLLVFAGLFSATVTAFTVESYKWLQEDNTDESNRLLAQISLQLSTTANGANQTSFPATQMHFVPEPRSVRINVFWFLSLILCLSTVVFGILCTQWLREFTRDASLTPEHAIPNRQMRYDGLIAWKVPEFISALPVILQMSVLLFFVGILDLLWSLHQVVAITATTAIGLTALILLCTTMAPITHCLHMMHRFFNSAAPPQCPYKSPLSWMFCRLVISVCLLLENLIPPSFRTFNIHAFRITSWLDFDDIWRKARQTVMINDLGLEEIDIEGLSQSIAWAFFKLAPAQNFDVIQDIFHCLGSGLPRDASRRIMKSIPRVASSIEESLNSLEEYDALMLSMLELYASPRHCWQLLDELRLRCMNSLKIAEEYLEDHYWNQASRRAINLLFNGKPMLCTIEVVLQNLIRMACKDTSLNCYIFVSNLLYTASHGAVNDENIPTHRDIQRLSIRLIDCFEAKASRAIASQDIPTFANIYSAFTWFFTSNSSGGLSQVESWDKKIREVPPAASISVPSRIVSFASQVLIQKAKENTALKISTSYLETELQRYMDRLRPQDNRIVDSPLAASPVQNATPPVTDIPAP